MGKRSQRRHGASESQRRILCRAQFLGRCSTTHPEAWLSVQARGARENSTQREASGTESRRQAAIAKPRDERHLRIWRGGCEPGGEAEWTRGADGVSPVARHDHSYLAPLLNRENPLGPITRSLASERPQRAETHETPRDEPGNVSGVLTARGPYPAPLRVGNELQRTSLPAALDYLC